MSSVGGLGITNKIASFCSIEQNEREDEHPLLIRFRLRSAYPETWPPPLAYADDRWAWLRSKILYSYCPADRDLLYAIRIERWMLAVPLSLVCPGISNVAWLGLLSLLLATVLSYVAIGHPSLVDVALSTITRSTVRTSLLCTPLLTLWPWAHLSSERLWAAYW